MITKPAITQTTLYPGRYFRHRWRVASPRLPRHPWNGETHRATARAALIAMSPSLPKMFRVRQNFPHPPPLDIRPTLAAEFGRLRPQIKPGARIAVGVRSRGIAHLSTIIAALLDQLRAAAAGPFIISSMRSH